MSTPSTPTSKGPTYQKIPTLFRRDRETKLVTDVFRDVEPAELADFPIWRFTEKIDGTNIRIIWDGHNITFGGRSNAAVLPKNVVAHLEENYLTNHFEGILEETFGETPAVIIGEGFGEKIQHGKYLSEGASFIAFDLMIDSQYVPFDEARGIIASLGIPLVPEHTDIRTITQAVEFVKTNPNSAWGDFSMEGLVGVTSSGYLKSNGERLIVKVKLVDFLG